MVKGAMEMMQEMIQNITEKYISLNINYPMQHVSVYGYYKMNWLSEIPIDSVVRFCPSCATHT